MPDRPLRVAVLSVGDELLAGDLVDTNAAWLAAQVRARGHRVTGFATVGDEAAAIAAAVRRALLPGEAEVLLVTGGLGPTNDDVTREGVAAACGLRLVEAPGLLAELAATYARAGRAVSESSRRQAWLPEGAESLPNPFGTAPGFVARGPGAVPPGSGPAVAVFPGVPSEMRAMATAVLPRLLPERVVFLNRSLLAAGLPEATAGEALADLMEQAGPLRDAVRVGITATLGVLTISVRGNDSDAVARAEGEVRRRLGAAVFGEGGQTLAGAVVAALAARKLTLTTAESCTGGLLAGAITAVPGSSAVFREGLVAYANAAKSERLGVPPELIAQHGAVSEPVALAMAQGARARAAADCALAVTGIAGPDGGTPDKPVGLVVIAACDPLGEAVRSYHWKGTRDELRARSVALALDLLRRRLPPR